MRTSFGSRVRPALRRRLIEQGQQCRNDLKRLGRRRSSGSMYLQLDQALRGARALQRSRRVRSEGPEGANNLCTGVRQKLIKKHCNDHIDLGSIVPNSGVSETDLMTTW